MTRSARAFDESREDVQRAAPRHCAHSRELCAQVVAAPHAAVAAAARARQTVEREQLHGAAYAQCQRDGHPPRGAHGGAPVRQRGIRAQLEASLKYVHGQPLGSAWCELQMVRQFASQCEANCRTTYGRDRVRGEAHSALPTAHGACAVRRARTLCLSGNFKMLSRAREFVTSRSLYQIRRGFDKFKIPARAPITSCSSRDAPLSALAGTAHGRNGHRSPEKKKKSLIVPDIPLLVFSNKKNLPEAVTIDQESNDLELHDLPVCNYKVLPTVATDSTNLPDGFKWIVEQLKLYGYS
ncbi:ArfX1 [Gracilaria domingensis]|nr:ArfX1 [Gracilaria domingensis]